MYKTNFVPLFHEVGERGGGFAHSASKYRLRKKDYLNFLDVFSRYPQDEHLITFDDGGKSNLDAVEAASDYNFTIKIFIPTAFIGKKGFMSEGEILDLAQISNVEIGSHSVNHPDFFNILTRSEQMIEMIDSKKRLEDILQNDVKEFSIPGGIAFNSSFVLAKNFYSNVYSSWQSNIFSKESIARFSIEQTNVNHVTKIIRSRKIQFRDTIVSNAKLCTLGSATTVFPRLFDNSKKILTQ